MMMCLGVAVKSLSQEVTLLATKKLKGKTLVGMPYTSGVMPIMNVRQYLVENGYVKEEDLMGNFMFISDEN